MSSYHGKLLELLNIENKSDHYLLHIRLSFSKDIEILWKVDEYTAENLKSIVEFNNQFKYRLSLNSYWDVIQKKCVSTLTKTYLNQSEQIHFSCSEDYMNALTSIKHSQNIRDLDMKSFKPIDLEPTYQYEQPTHNLRFAWIPLAIMSFLFSILLSYLGLTYLNETPYNEHIFIQPVLAANMANNKQIKKPDPVDTKLANFIELDQAITYSIPKGNVALTFSDGPSKYSMEIMDVLNKYQVGGTFFFIGSNVAKHQDYVKAIHSNGYPIGIHSMSHPNLPNLSYEEQEEEFIQSSKLLEEVTQDKVVLFRPPYGAFNEQTKDLIDQYQYKMILWNNDPRDWETRDADIIFNDIQNSNVSGSIIILHESQATLEALPKIIEYLQGLDLKIINLQ